MAFPSDTINIAPKQNRIFFPLLISFLILSYGTGSEAANRNKHTNIGAFIDDNYRAGKEEKIAMKIAAESFNNTSESNKMLLHFRNPGGDPYLSASAG